jgi:hypothetical protein
MHEIGNDFDTYAFLSAFFLNVPDHFFSKWDASRVSNIDNLWLSLLLHYSPTSLSDLEALQLRELVMQGEKRTSVQVESFRK